MATKTKALPIFLSLLVVLALVEVSHGKLVIYWGQDSSETSLNATCNSGLYDLVNIAFLNKFGSGRTPQLNLAGHCNPANGGCKSLSSEIINCQKKKIKVLLSIGGGIGQYSLASTADAKKFADYLYNNFLGGKSTSRPFGTAVLDGIDFKVELGSAQHWDDLVRFLAAYSKPGRRIFLSAAPKCSIPDKFLGAALRTGLLGHLWVQFYNNPQCQYRPGDTSKIIATWKQWASMKWTTKLLLGMPASKAAGSGFIPAGVLINQIMPEIKKTPKFGGVMLWNRFYDRASNYTAVIRSSV
ncbi:hypothetical protein COLO4_04248 [Corchorus olitorius]|uniref:chitinase n=1 Tax=Corchorus olitorius TaxID=93759 RepID=A0A1R3KUS5_9ROSI|nr:hypothetical protein COLO4_34404 [Corchorus olitorius]OMP10816.1 hypothetical protein COLO4_04248 [Corchorus olitorius]